MSNAQSVHEQCADFRSESKAAGLENCESENFAGALRELNVFS
jgi:hypothetical protein